MRDMNRAILDNPFDQELQSITVPFGALLRSIVVTVDAHGLKHKYLKSHARAVVAFFDALVERTMNLMPPKPCRSVYSAIASACSHSCNMTACRGTTILAENAIKRISDYREDVGRSVSEAGLTEHLVLLSIYQTCRVRDISFLKFLLSRERDIDAFAAGKRQRQRAPRIELYPKGYLPPSIGSLRRGQAMRASDTMAAEAE